MHSLFFQTVFAATAATIVSGAIAERTKFTTYLIFSLLMTLLIYPISGSWVWNAGGWLRKWDLLILPVQV
jgi:Amt family ammonium transporter